MKKSRFGVDIETNRDHYKGSSAQIDAWVKWSQEHQEQIVLLQDWLDMPYE